jgi:hypothetical protein
MSTLSIKDMSHNEEIDSNEMAAIEGGITFPAGNVAVVTAKLIAPPQPVTYPGVPTGGSVSGGDPGSGGGGGGFYLDGPYGDDDLHQF